jgi:hypothetical protein
MTIKIKLSAKSLTIGDVVRAEQGLHNTEETVDFLARFVVDDDGNKVDHSEAVNAIYELPMADLPGLARQLTEQIKAWQEVAVPLVTATN